MNQYVAALKDMVLALLRIAVGIALVLLIGANCVMLYSLDKARDAFQQKVTHLDAYLQKTEPKYAAFIANFKAAEAEREEQILAEMQAIRESKKNAAKFLNQPSSPTKTTNQKD